MMTRDGFKRLLEDKYRDCAVYLRGSGSRIFVKIQRANQIIWRGTININSREELELLVGRK